MHTISIIIQMTIATANIILSLFLKPDTTVEIKTAKYDKTPTIPVDTNW